METINAYNSNSVHFNEAFPILLKHTDQKVKMRQSLQHIIQGLPDRRLFVDVGAGEGGTTSWIAEQFERTIAIEPNPVMRAALEEKCSDIEIQPHTIMDAHIQPAAADFVLCANVYGYIGKQDWDANVEKMLSWLSSDGMLVLIHQHHLNDVWQMRAYFGSQPFDWSAYAHAFQERHGKSHMAHTQIVPSRVTIPTMQSAYTVAELFLNFPPLSDPPSRHDVEAYIEKHFRDQNGGYCHSIDQFFIQIQRKG